MAEVTMTDVARAAGVGVATVDRVINKRARVRPETAQRVLDAAEQLGFRRTGLIRRRIDERTLGLRLGFILQRRGPNFYRALGQALQEAVQSKLMPPGQAVIEYLDELTPLRVAQALEDLEGQVDAIALVAADDPRINHAIDGLASRGTPVFALISDLSAESCAGYVGLDQRRVGRTAAWGIARLSARPGKVGLMVGSQRYLCQEQNEIGFRAYLREYAPEFEVLETQVSLEDRELAQVAMLELLKRHPDMVGFYIAGGGIEGVVQALEERALACRLVTVCHDLTDVTRSALIDGRVDLVLSHQYDWIADSLVAAMADAVAGKHRSGKVQIVQPFVTHTAASV